MRERRPAAASKAEYAGVASVAGRWFVADGTVELTSQPVMVTKWRRGSTRRTRRDQGRGLCSLTLRLEARHCFMTSSPQSSMDR